MHKVIKSFKGSPDGFTVLDFKEGEPFEHDGELLQVALQEGWVEKVKSAAPAKTTEQLKDAVNKKIEGLTKALNKAAADKKPTAQAKLDAAKAELAALG